MDKVYVLIEQGDELSADKVLGAYTTRLAARVARAALLGSEYKRGGLDVEIWSDEMGWCGYTIAETELHNG